MPNKHPGQPWPAAVGALLVACAVQAEVPLHADSTGHVVVPTLVNGRGPFDFIFDTAADETSVFSWLATKLALPPAGGGTIDGATGVTAASMSRIAALSVDGHVIKGVDALTMPDRSDGATLGGIVGADLMVGRLAVLDVRCASAALLPLNQLSAAIGPGARMISAGSIPGGKQLSVPVTINGVSGTALLDSGARGTLINTRFAASAGIDLRSVAFHEGEPARGATRVPVSTRTGPIGAVAFAGMTHNDVTARVADLPVFASAGLADRNAMILGLDLLRDVRLTVDYAARRVWVAPTLCAPKLAARLDDRVEDLLAP